MNRRGKYRTNPLPGFDHHKIEMKMEKKRVIDADNNKILETFDPKYQHTVQKKYEAMGKWTDVSVDCDGDIILWED